MSKAERKRKKKATYDLEEIRRRVRDRNYSKILESKPDSISAAGYSGLIPLGPNIQVGNVDRLQESRGEICETPAEMSSTSTLYRPKNQFLKPDYGLTAADEQTLKNHSQWSRMSDLVSPRIAAYNKHRDF